MASDTVWHEPTVSSEEGRFRLAGAVKGGVPDEAFMPGSHGNSRVGWTVVAMIALSALRSQEGDAMLRRRTVSCPAETDYLVSSFSLSLTSFHSSASGSEFLVLVIEGHWRARSTFSLMKCC